jgi:hypothetical protein
MKLLTIVLFYEKKFVVMRRAYEQLQTRNAWSRCWIAICHGTRMPIRRVCAFPRPRTATVTCR